MLPTRSTTARYTYAATFGPTGATQPQPSCNLTATFPLDTTHDTCYLLCTAPLGATRTAGVHHERHDPIPLAG